jgi:hypothetical protein
MCFTLCDETELYERKIRGLRNGEDGPAPGDGSGRLAEAVSHADLFGPFAIAMEPLIARSLDVVPTQYFAPSALQGRRFNVHADAEPGLGLQMIQRLKEMRDVFIALSMVESGLKVEGGTLPSEDMLQALDLDLPFDESVVRRIRGLNAARRRDVLALFDTDRAAALHLVGFIDMMMSMFQETDSTIDGAVLAFYEQREWRLVHHMREGMRWYCLGPQPTFRDPMGPWRQRHVEELRTSLMSIAGHSLTDEYFAHCWLLEQVDGRPTSQLISRVLVPARVLVDARNLLEAMGCVADVVAAEDFGYRNDQSADFL